MGKVNRFMPTNDYSLYDTYQDGEIYWSFLENEVDDTSCLTISFIRNVPNIENKYLKEIIYKRGLGYLDSKKYYNYNANKTGIFKEIEFWDPIFEELPKYMEEAKGEFYKECMKRIQFTPDNIDDELLIKILKKEDITSDNLFDKTFGIYDSYGNVKDESEVNVYHFSEWLDSMEVLSEESIKKAKGLFSSYEFKRLLPEWYYTLEVYKSGYAILNFDIEKMAIDVSEGGPYEYIETEKVEPFIQNRIADIFDKLQALDFNPSWA